MNMNKRVASFIIVMMFLINIFSIFPIVKASTLWSEDFEDALTDWYYTDGTLASNYDITTDWFHDGSHSVHGDLVNNLRMIHNFTTSSHTGTWDFYYKLSAVNGIDEGFRFYIYVGHYFTANDMFLCVLSFTSDGKVNYQYMNDASDDDTNSIYHTTVNSAINTVHQGDTLHIQIYTVIGSGTDSHDGSTIVYIDGAEIFNIDNIDNFWTIGHEFSDVYLLNNYGDTYDDYYVDEMIFTDSIPLPPDKTLTVSSVISEYAHPTGLGTCNVTTDTYTHGTFVYALATPDDFSHFQNWIYDGVDVTTNPLIIEMTSDHTLQPVFDWGVIIQGYDNLSSFPTGYTNVGCTKDTVHFISTPNSVESNANQEYFIKDLNVTFNGNWGTQFYFGSLHSMEPNPYPLFTAFSDNYTIQAQILAQASGSGYYKLQCVVWTPNYSSPFFANGTLDDYVYPASYLATDIVTGLTEYGGWYSTRIYFWESLGQIEVFINGVSKGNFTVNNPNVNALYFCYGNPYKYFASWGHSMYGDINYDELEIAYMNMTNLEFLNVTINSWLFKNEVYELNTWFVGATTAQFNLTDTVHTIMFNWYNATHTGDIKVLDEDGTYKNEYVINGISIISSFYSNETSNIVWKFMLNNNIVDSFNNTLTYKISDNLYTITGNTGKTPSIYNHGGLAQYNFAGDGYIVEGGSALQVSAMNSTLVGGGSFAEAWLTYRRLQYYHTLFEWDLDSKLNTPADELAHQESIGYLEYSMDYKLVDSEDGAWIDGLKCIINLLLVDVGDKNGSADSASVTYRISWYNNGDFILNDTLTTYDYAYAYWIGDAPVASVQSDFCTNRTSIPIWLDFWFDKSNASKTIGGRINSQYFGEYEDGVNWWFGYHGFRPSIKSVTSSMVFADLKDGSGNIISSQKISLVRIRVKISKTYIGTVIDGHTGDEDRWSMLPYQFTNIMTTNDRMIGIDTPSFVETREIKMQGYSAFDPVTTIISSLGSILINSLFGWGKMMIGAIDTVLSWVGLPYGTFSSFVNLVTTIFTALIGMLYDVVSMISQGLSLITLFFSTILNFTSYIINIILFFGVDLFSVPIQIIALFMAVLNGTSITFYGMYLDFTPYASLMVALKVLLVPLGSIYLVAWIFWGNIEMNGEPDMIGAVKRVISLFGYMKELYTNLFWIYNKIRKELLNAYGFLKSHIPTLGSTPDGGGE